VQVNRIIRHWDDHLFVEVRDHFRRGTLEVSGVEAVQIAIVHRRDTAPGFGCQEKDHWQQDHAAADLCCIQHARKFGDRDLPFVFVAVNPSREDKCRPVPVADDCDRQGNPPIG
jgi:hypothetical protein